MDYFNWWILVNTTVDMSRPHVKAILIFVTVYYKMLYLSFITI